VVTVVGSNMVDLITYVERMPASGETIEAPEFRMGFGGKGANQAVAAARLGAKVHMVSRVGDDLFGPRTVENFRNNDIDTRHVTVAQGASSGVAPIFVEPDSNNRILIVKGANSELLPADVDKAQEIIRESDMVILQLEIRLETVIHTVETCSNFAVPVLLNPAPANRALSVDSVRNVEFFVPNESELSLITGMPTGSMDEIATAARSLRTHGLKNVIVTMGERGTFLSNDDREVHVAPTRVKSVDTTGAGDAFVGCFSVMYCRHGDLERAVKEANHYAAMSTTRRGTQTSFGTVDDMK